MSDSLSRARDSAGKLLQFFSAPPPACLYHYTTAAGLLGILKKDDHQFWASTVGFSNDASEGRSATRILGEVLDLEGHPLAKDDAEECKQVAGVARSFFYWPNCPWEEGYVISFCEKDNILSQWRAYGNSAGFSIGFRALSANALVCPAGSDVRLVKVEYDVSQQTDRLRSVLDTVYAVLKDDSLSSSGMDRVGFASSLLYAGVTEWACTVKHAAFEEEQEWRITVFPTYKHFSLLSGGRPRLACHPELRECRGRLLPYAMVKPKAGKFDIKSITVGPSKTQALDAKAVELLKEKLGLGDVEVVLSDIPLQS